jgi:hypothetical protein
MIVLRELAGSLGGEFRLQSDASIACGGQSDMDDGLTYQCMTPYSPAIFALYATGNHTLGWLPLVSSQLISHEVKLP